MANISIEYSCDSQNIPRIHYHNNYELIFIEKGSSIFLINNRKIKTKKDTLVIISKLENHSMKILKNPYQRFIIQIKTTHLLTGLPADVYMKLFQKRPEDFPYIFKFNETDANKVKEILTNMVLENKKLSLTENYLNLLVNQLIVFIYRSNSKFFNKKSSDLENTVVDIQNYINKNYAEDISLDTIEKNFFISKYTLSRNFKKITGYSFKTYLILVRLSMAKNLLVGSDFSIEKIAHKIGYKSDNIFIRMFKKYEDMTPSNYRKLFKK